MTPKFPYISAAPCAALEHYLPGHIMKLVHLLMAATVVVSAPAFANKELAQKNNCLACHAVDKKLVGPAYQEVAKKYAGQKDAVANLTKSIKAGGAGKWGAVPMPAQAGLSDADAKTLATWILAGAK
jgi:cytochrome c